MQLIEKVPLNYDFSYWMSFDLFLFRILCVFVHFVHLRLIFDIQKLSNGTSRKVIYILT